MRRYIDTDLLKDKTTRVNNIWNVTTNAEGKGLDEIIDDIPTADVRENVRGEWLSGDCMGASCSKCGEYFSFRTFSEVHNFNFCPNCGAEMRGKEE